MTWVEIIVESILLTHIIWGIIMALIDRISRY
jgi:hypothetical protein